MDILQNKKPGGKLQGNVNADYWARNILLYYIFTMPFVSAFSFTGTLSMPLFFAVFLFSIVVYKTIKDRQLPKDFLGFDILLIVLLFFIIFFSYAVNGIGNKKALNHTIAYVTTFLLFYACIKFIFCIIENKSHLIKNVLQFIFFATFCSALFSNIEFILNNFVGIDLNEYIPRPVEGEEKYNPLVLGLFIRARGFATESGHFTFMMELFSPLTVYYIYFSGFCKWNAISKALVCMSIFFSFIFAASSASFVIVPMAVGITILIYLPNFYLYLKKYPLKFIGVSAVIGFSIAVFNYLFSLSTLVLLSVTDKLDSSSLDDRESRIDFFYDVFLKFDFIKKLIGTGPAGHEIIGTGQSILSLYYSIIFEIGLLGFILIGLLFFYFIYCTFSIRTKLGFCLMISLISGCIHYHFIANFWYPWFWFIAVFAVVKSKSSFANQPDL